VSQEPILFNCSIEENIAYGLNGNASITEIENAAVSFDFLSLEIIFPTTSLSLYIASAC